MKEIPKGCFDTWKPELDWKLWRLFENKLEKTVLFVIEKEDSEVIARNEGIIALIW